MPKGNATTRRLRKELREKEAELEQWRASIRRPVAFDWICRACSYYCYHDKDRCPKCSRSKGQGVFCLGYQRRLPVAPAHIQQPVGNQRNIQQQQPQQRPQQHQQGNIRAALPTGTQVARQTQPRAAVAAATRHSYVDAARSAVQNTRVQQEAVGHGASGGPRVAGLQTVQNSATAPLALFAVAKPPGAIVPPAAAAAVQPETHEIHSEGGRFNWGDDEPEDATIAELDPQVTDPNRVLRRLQGVRKAIDKRNTRLEKAQQECESHRQALEQAKNLLQTKEDAVRAAEAEVQYFRDVHKDLTQRYTALTEAAELQERQSKQAELQQSQLQTKQQAIWQVATAIRGFGEDPRIESALASLESFLNSIQGQAVQQQAQQQQQSQQPAHSTPPPPQVQPSSHGNSATASVCSPAAASAVPNICPRCWSIVCRCGPPNVGAVSGASSMEVDQERGAKRSCRDAELPESASAGQGSPGALLVDAEGKAVAPQEVGPAGAAQCPGTLEGSQSDAVLEDCASPPQGTVSDGQPSGAQLGAPSAATAEAVVEAGLRGSYSKSDKADESSREASKASFARLVKSTCSQRCYPY